MKYLIIYLVVLSSIGICQAQDLQKHNRLYFEVGGSGLFASVNYEKQLPKLPALGLRVGLGFYTEKAFYMTVPVGLTYAFALKKSNTFLDIGLNLTYSRIDGRVFTQEQNSNGNHFTSIVPSIAYRKHFGKDTFWRIGFTPVFNQATTLPWLGFSLGRQF
jgi:hypothetical protein